MLTQRPAAALPVFCELLARRIALHGASHHQAVLVDRRLAYF